MKFPAHQIKLKEIPPEGKTYSYSRATGELNNSLKDLIELHEYQAEVFIKPLNSKDFELKAAIRTFAPDICSRCGLDFKFNINLKLSEIMIPEQPQDRTGKYVRVNHLSDNSENRESLEYDSTAVLDIGEYFHGQLGLAIPVNPAPPVNAQGNCGDCGVRVLGASFNYDEVLEETPQPSPFAVLQDLKVQIKK